MSWLSMWESDCVVAQLLIVATEVFWRWCCISPIIHKYDSTASLLCFIVFMDTPWAFCGSCWDSLRRYMIVQTRLVAKTSTIWSSLWRTSKTFIMLSNTYLYMYECKERIRVQSLLTCGCLRCWSRRRITLRTDITHLGQECSKYNSNALSCCFECYKVYTNAIEGSNAS